MSPTDCPKCAVEFARSYMLQAAARHELAKHGAGAARVLIDEALNEHHCEHAAGAVRTMREDTPDA